MPGTPRDADEELDALRAAIDRADRAIVAQLAVRREVVEALAAHKRAVGRPPVDPAREAELRDRWRAAAREEGLADEVAIAVLEAILTVSRRLMVSLVQGNEPESV